MSRPGKTLRRPRGAATASRAASSPATVLVAVTGLSPAVLTETVWALAHEPNPTIPDRLIVLTTETGRDAIATQLFGPDQIWQQLRASVLGPDHGSDPRLDFDCVPDRVKVFHRRAGTRRTPIRDVTSLADNKAIADAMADELWTQTSKPDTRVVASLAGGYKTMSALFLSAMQLLSNPGDRVTHVLVGGGFEQARPRFYFPDQRPQHLAGPTGPLCAADAASLIQLIDVPVIPLRRWFEDLLHIKPPSYETLLTQGAAALETARSSDLRLELGPAVLPAGTKSRHFALINGIRLALTPDRFVYLRFFAERLVAGGKPFDRPIDAVEEICAWLVRMREHEPRFFRMSEALEAGKFDGEDLVRRLSDLRRFLIASLEPGRRLAAVLPGKGHWALQLPREAIVLHDIGTP